MKFKQKIIKSIAFMIHTNSSTNDLTVNNLDNDGESLAGGALDCTTYSEETSTIPVLMDDTICSITKMTSVSHMGETTMDA